MTTVPTVLICRRVADQPKYQTVAGTTRRACDECREPVWISPAGVLMVPDRVVCMQCDALAGSGRVLSPATPAQVAEVLAFVRGAR